MPCVLRFLCLARFDGEHLFLAWREAIGDVPHHPDFAMLIADWDGVIDVPRAMPSRRHGGDFGCDGVLLGLVDTAFGVLQSGPCRRLSDTGGSGIPGHGARDTGTSRAGASRGAFGEHGCAAAEQRGRQGR